MAVPSVDRQTFLANLRQSGLLADEELAAVAAELPETERGRVVARALVARGLLTKFQAEQLLAGRTGGFFLGPYRILEQLGQGGMGRVYKAEHRTLKRVVALKALTPGVLRSARAQELFRREVRANARLVHPNIVAALDAGRGANGRYYLVLEYVNGPNLDQLVRAGGPLPVGQACSFLRQALLGLEHAHERGLLHRDLKPANLLLQPAEDGRVGHGVVKISDFGLARLNEPADETGAPGTIHTRRDAIVGTPDYLSPEQARNVHRADGRSDLYSLGCTLYFLLTGQVPFPGGSTLEKVLRHANEEPVPVERLRPDVPADVAAVVRRLMAKRPEDRFPTPAEAAAALAPFATDGPTAWAKAETAVPLEDEAATPSPEAGPSHGDGNATTSEPAGAAATLPLEPAAGLAPPADTLIYSRPEDQQVGQRRQAALVWALGIIGGLLTAATALALFLE